ncbi:MAG: tRNA-dihydrouridine synthase [Parcubacteria group bacterium GW2011_GWA2_43_11]|nr:MAG: tRNA-dihydrouridine synthase [Parcubacteria group bacterium GW2011_GWC2_42_11]KKS85818.1 MAG: tRNA-dihydrouridine synthase [Parcubacteria group bacterium GW2011_GWA2_43_11]
MAEITDPAFRSIIAKYGKPDVLWTEFVSADGLYHTREIHKIPDADNPLMKDLFYEPGEHPIVAQLFSAQPNMIEYASRLVTELGFDGVDINMGCPYRAIEKQGAGASLMKKPELARALIQSAKKGTQGRIPVSVKTRIGYAHNDLSTWLPELLKEDPALITVHARTRQELSNVPARWEHVREAVEIRDKLSNKEKVLIFGNGDVDSAVQARTLAMETGADGVMIGRGILGNPWLFSEKIPTLEEKLEVLIEHSKAFDKLCAHKSFALLKRHFKSYVTDFKGAKELRVELFACENIAEAVEKLKVECLKLKAQNKS